MDKRLIWLVLFFTGCWCANGQQAYFADGYHGGIYGHYPAGYTRFITEGMNKFPLWRLNMEIEPETWDSVKVNDPASYAEFRLLAADPRMEFTNPTYAQPYLYNISGESIIRQFEYGIKKLRTHFPYITLTTYSAEEPCFTSSLPQILKLFGFKYAVLKNPDTMWGGYMSPYGGELVNWVGPDGTQMVTVPRYACEKLEHNSTWQSTAWNNSEAYIAACFAQGIEHPVGMTFQDAGWENGPWLGQGGDVHNQYVTWTEYIERVSAGWSNDNYRISQNDVRVALMWGSQVLQRVAQRVRVSENSLVAAEKISTMAAIEKRFKYPYSELDEAWRTLMLAQHHDAWIVPYNKLHGRGTWAGHVVAWTDSTDVKAGCSVAAALKAFVGKREKDSPLVARLFNPTGIERYEAVKLDVPAELAGRTLAVHNTSGVEIPSVQYELDGREVISFCDTVPAFGYSSYTLKRKVRTPQSFVGIEFAENGDCIMENNRYRIVIDAQRGGVIKSLVAKKVNGKEFADATGKFGMGEIRGHFYREGVFHSSADAPVRISIVEDTPHVKSVKLEGQIGIHPFSQTVTIERGKRTVDFDLEIDWHGNPGIGEYAEWDWGNRRRAFYDTRYMLNLMFPNTLSMGRVYKNAPFDVCEESGNTFFNRWDSIKNNVILNWVDYVQDDGNYGLAVYSDHTTSYSHGTDFPLSLTAQYSGGGLWGRNYTIDGPTRMKYSLMPHNGSWDKGGVVETGVLRNEKIVTLMGYGIPVVDRSFVRLDNPGYEITAFKADKGGILLRLFNASGDEQIQTVRLGFPVEKIERIDLNGNVISEAVFVASGSVAAMSLSLPRFGLETFRLTLKK